MSDPNSIRDSEHRQLLVSVQNGEIDRVRSLLKSSYIDLKSIGILGWAATFGQTEIVKLLLEDGRVDPSAINNEAVRLAAYRGNADMIRLLLEDGRTDPSDSSNDAILGATLRDDPESVKLLLRDHRVDGTIAIKYAHCTTSTLSLLSQNERCGMDVNRWLFMRYPSFTKRYDELDGERSSRKWVAVWCMKEIGEGWEDVMWPFSDRMGKAELDGF